MTIPISPIAVALLATALVTPNLTGAPNDGQVAAIVYDEAEPPDGFGSTPTMKFVGSAGSEDSARALMKHPDAASYSFSDGATIHNSTVTSTPEYFQFKQIYDFKRGPKINREETIYIWKESFFVPAQSPRSFSGMLNVSPPMELGRLADPTRENLEKLATHLHFAGNDRAGYRVVSAPQVHEREGATDLSLTVARMTKGDFGVADNIHVIQCTLRLDKESGKVKYVGTEVRQIRGKRNPRPEIRQ